MENLAPILTMCMGSALMLLHVFLLDKLRHVTFSSFHVLADFTGFEVNWRKELLRRMNIL
jgi:hypothetical protein